MIPTILFFLLKHYKRHQPVKAARIQLLVNKAGRITGLVILCLVISLFSSSQDKKLTYNVIRNGSTVGTVNYSQATSGNRTTLKMDSEVKTRFIFTFTAKAQEETIYDNGIMTWSFIYRKMNGNEKANKKTKAFGNCYTIFKGSKKETLNKFPILYNMLSLYTTEPATISQVYSDNFEQFLTIQKTKEHKYKIELPDGNYNYYLYENGVLNTIEIHHSLYSASIQLKK